VNADKPTPEPNDVLAYAENIIATLREPFVVLDKNLRVRTANAAFYRNFHVSKEGTEGHNGLEAVETAESFRPELVLLDIGLPKLNGYDVARRIRKQPWSRDVILVALTGWGQEDDRRRSQEAGFNFHLVKPVELAALERLLAGS